MGNSNNAHNYQSNRDETQNSSGSNKLAQKQPKLPSILEMIRTQSSSTAKQEIAAKPAPIETSEITIETDNDVPDETSFGERNIHINIPHIKNHICLQQLNELSNRYDFSNNSPEVKISAAPHSNHSLHSGDRRAAVSSQKNIIAVNRKDLAPKQDPLREQLTPRNKNRRFDRGFPDSKAKFLDLPVRSTSERDNELIKSTLGLQKPIKLEKLDLENGLIYEGEWMNGKKEGKGVLIWLDGSKYEGDFKNNMCHGWGLLTHADGDTYEGQWMNDHAQGFGTYTFGNGVKYVGEWRNDKKHGFGKEKFYDGSEYEGEYVNGMKHGKGMLKFSNGNYYLGEFKSNEFQGTGTFMWLGDRQYRGQWLKSKLHGKGEMTWKDGRKYTGFYFEDRKHGEGVFQWGDGRKYSGLWSQGRQHGRGEFLNSNNQLLTGNWEEGRPRQSLKLQ